MLTRELQAAGPRKLHLGCGSNLLDGWINTDSHPRTRDVIYLDATRSFPLEAQVLDYVFHEHMIEHIPYRDGLFMLSECYRVLKSGGKIRVATPDLRFLMELYEPTKTPLQQEYITWTSKRFKIDRSFDADTFVINNFFRDWGHQFIYDEKVLADSLQRCGFRSVTRCNLLESADEALRGLENAARYPAGFLELETMVLEATKP